MSTDNIVTQAAAAAAAPPDGPLVVEMSYNEAKAAEAKATETARVAALSPAERRIEEIRRDPRFMDFNHPERAALMQEYKRMVTAQVTPDEVKAWEETALATKREFYDLAPPELPGPIAEVYEQEYGWAEADMITLSRNMGLPTATVRAVRDAGVRLAMQIDGAPLSDEVVDGALKRLDLTDLQRAEFKRLFRELEGGA